MLQGLPPTTPLMAFADESFREDPTEGVYVLAAAVLEGRAQQPARELMRSLLGSRRTNKLHWHEMDRLQQKDAAHRVAGIEGFHVVAVGAPVPRRRQERARAACLTVLVGELHGFGMQRLLIEARAADLNRRDVATVQGACFALPKVIVSVLTTYLDLPSRCCGLPMWLPEWSGAAAKAARSGLSC